MKKKNLIIIFVVILCVMIYYIRLHFKDNNNYENELESGKEDVTEKIENEEYYKEKQEEFIKKEDEYEEVLTSYINNMFSKEELNELSKCNQKLTETANSGNKDAFKAASAQKKAFIEEVSQRKFTDEQKDKLKQIQTEKEKLENIVDEYTEKKAKLEEEEYWKDRQTLEDGTIINEREAVISDKECEGLKFTNISLKYIPEKDCTKFSAKVTNISEITKEGLVSIKITGDVETIFPIDIERLEAGEYYDFEIDVPENISMAKTLDIVKYNEKDYEDSSF